MDFASYCLQIRRYVENGSLANIIKPNKFGPFPESLVAVYIAQVCQFYCSSMSFHDLAIFEFHNKSIMYEKGVGRLGLPPRARCYSSGY